MLTRQRQVADDDADPIAVELINATITERLMTGAQQEAKHRVETGEKVGIDIEVGDSGRIGLVVEETGFFRIDFISCTDRRIIGLIRLKQPTPLWRLPRGVNVVGNRFPETIQGRRHGKYAADPDNCNRFSVLHPKATPWSLLRWKLAFSEAAMTHS